MRARVLCRPSWYLCYVAAVALAVWFGGAGPALLVNGFPSNSRTQKTYKSRFYL
jgi:hypothetical protein